MEITKQELLTAIKSQIEEQGVSEEKVNEIVKRITENIKGSMMEEFNEKLTELEKKQDNKLKDIKFQDNDDDKKPKWNSFGEFLQKVMVAESKNGEVDQRLVPTKAISGANELIGAEGGFLVNPEYSNEILKIAHDTGIVAKACRHLTINGNRLVMNAVDETSRATGSRWGGIQGYWVSEGGTATATKPKFRQITLSLNKLMGIHYATEEVLNDASALEGITVQGFGEEFAFMIDDAIVNGVGGGQPLGVRNSGAIVSKAKETNQEADTILAENIAGMWNLMPAKNRSKATWYAIQDVEPQLFKMHYAMGTGALPVFTPPVNYGTGGLVGAPNNGSLLARPLQIIEQCQELGDEGDILFLDLSQYMIIEKAGGIQPSTSLHVRFLYDEQTFKFTYRMDGQPMWHSALTAYNSTVERSPYITLAERA